MAKPLVTDCLTEREIMITTEQVIAAYEKIGYKPITDRFENYGNNECCVLTALAYADGMPHVSAGRCISYLKNKYGDDEMRLLMCAWDGDIQHEVYSKVKEEVFKYFYGE